MAMSEKLESLAEALAKAQREIEGAKKDTVNPFFKSKYADLASIWEAIRKPLSDNGLSVVQLPDKDGDLTTMLLHSSGQWIQSTIKIKSKDDTAQAMGSAITYARRYALAAMVGVYQEDDDGSAAQKTPVSQAPIRQAAQPQQKPKTSYPIADSRAEPPPIKSTT